jgi:hypothetical protein
MSMGSIIVVNSHRRIFGAKKMPPTTRLSAYPQGACAHASPSEKVNSAVPAT